MQHVAAWSQHSWSHSRLAAPSGASVPMMATVSTNTSIHSFLRIAVSGHECILVLAPCQPDRKRRDRQRSSLRTTSFRPDQTSSTAQTLTSTKPRAPEIARSPSMNRNTGRVSRPGGKDERQCQGLRPRSTQKSDSWYSLSLLRSVPQHAGTSEVNLAALLDLAPRTVHSTSDRSQPPLSQETASVY